MLNYEDFQQIKDLKDKNYEAYTIIKKMSDFCLNTLSISFHDIKNHIAYISSYCQLAKLKNEPLTQTREFSRIETGLKDLTNLSTRISLLRYSFCDSDFIECSLSDIWKNALDTVKNYASNPSYKILNANTIENCSFKLFCNPENTAQALSEIILNAIEACETGNAVLSVSLSEQGDFLHLSISDNGGGFSDEMLVEGMNPFVTEKANHTGLGLCIAAITLCMQNGNLLLSNTDNGAKVTAIFPRL